MAIHCCLSSTVKQNHIRRHNLSPEAHVEQEQVRRLQPEESVAADDDEDGEVAEDADQADQHNHCI